MHEITGSGFVEVITGSMFSGKTEELLRRLRRARIAGQTISVFTPAMDDRYGTRTTGSHAGREWEATVVDPSDPWTIVDHVDTDTGSVEPGDADDPRGDATDGAETAPTDTTSAPDGRTDAFGDGRRPTNGVVAVDEANFFERELVGAVERLADDGYRVVVAGTDQTFRGEPFRPLPALTAVAEYVDKLRAICAVCGEPATRNQRLVDGEPAHAEDPTIVVGAEERYEARCRNCHVVRRD